MLNVKRRCQFNLTTNDDFYLNNNNNNNNNIKQETDGHVQKFCLQHNNCNCSTPEVRICTRKTEIKASTKSLREFYPELK